MTRSRNPKLEVQHKDVQHNLDRALTELHRVKRQAKILKKQNRRLLKGTASSPSQSEERELIPRPPGHNGKDGWILRDKMGLSTTPEQKLLYNSIRSGVRVCMDTAGLDVAKPFKRQETGRLYQCYTLAKERYPFLRRFDGDWATCEIVKDVLINRRKYQIKLAGQAPENTNDQEHSPAHSEAESEGRESSVPAGSEGSEGTDDEEDEVGDGDDISD